MTNSTHSASASPGWPLGAHILGGMDRLAALVVTLGDDTFNVTLPVPAINSLTVLLCHVTGSARYWPERVRLGCDYIRDRNGEPSAHYSIAEGLKTYHHDRAAIESTLVELQGVDRAAAPAMTPTNKDRWWYSSIEGVIVYVFHRAAQHLGRAEITRNTLAAGLGGDGFDDGAGSSFSHPLDTVIDVLAQVGHASGFIEHTADSKIHITTVGGKAVIV